VLDDVEDGRNSSGNDMDCGWSLWCIAALEAAADDDDDEAAVLLDEWRCFFAMVYLNTVNITIICSIIISRSSVN